MFGTIAARFNDDGVTALYQHLRGALAGSACRPAGTLPAVEAQDVHQVASPSCRRPGPATWPRSPRPCGATTPAPPSRRPPCAPPAPARRAERRWPGARRLVAERRPLAAVRRRRAPSAADRALLDDWPATLEAFRGQTHPSGAVLRRESLSGTLVPRVALPRFADHGELLRFLRSENLPGRFPFTAGVFPFKREGEDPARMFAGEGDAVPHQPPLPPPGRGPAGATPVDRLRLGHALRLRPRRAPRHLRQGRQLRRVDRHPRRHEGAVRRLRPVRPDDVGVDDDQRPGAHDPGHVPQHRHRPAPRAVSGRARGPDRGEAAEVRAGCWPTCGAPCRPTSSRRTRARTPASSPPSSPSG